MSNENKSEEVLAVEKSFTDNFECAFSIDEYNRTPDIEAIAIHTDLPMDFDVACDSEEQKESHCDAKRHKGGETIPIAQGRDDAKDHDQRVQQQQG